jgi:tellurite resistance protein TerC
MDKPILFPFSEFWGFYLCFVFGVVFILLLDLGVLHRKVKEVDFRSALRMSIVWVALAMVYSLWFYGFVHQHLTNHPHLVTVYGMTADQISWELYLQFLAGYVVEKALAADNIFVFLVLFNFFKIPTSHQHRVLFYGIIGALFFRGIFIASGALILGVDWMMWLFGALLVFTGCKLFFENEEEIDVESNKVLLLVKKYLPVTPTLRDDAFFVRESGRVFATPLFVCLIVVEISDIIFAFDSVPAIFALTREPLVVFTSNIFAILGLRAMYFLLASVVDKFHLLRYGLAIVLVFIGLKMAILNHLFKDHFPIGLSLIFIVLVIGSSIGLSFVIPPRVKVDEK